MIKGIKSSPHYDSVVVYCLYSVVVYILLLFIVVRSKLSAESLSLLVLQSVHNDDKKLLEQVIRIDTKRVIDSTVRKLSVTAIVPFLKAVSNGIIIFIYLFLFIFIYIL